MIKPTLYKWSPDKLPMKGMQTSPSPLLMSREHGTLGAQNIGEDTNLLMQGFKFSFTRLGGAFVFIPLDGIKTMISVLKGTGDISSI